MSYACHLYLNNGRKLNTYMEQHMNTRAIPSPTWTTRQAGYIEWLATPSLLRSPDTELALSKTLGVRLSVLKGWCELPGFMPAVRKAAREALGLYYADVLHKLEEEAINGSFQHQKLYLQLIEAWS
jgi:hypothetical protein